METTTTLAGTEINKNALYFVDWNNLKGVEDLVLIFGSFYVEQQPVQYRSSSFK